MAECAEITPRRLADLEGELQRLRLALAGSEGRLAHLAAELALIYRAVPVGLCVVDTELRYVRINERLAQMNGLPALAHPGKSVKEIVPGIAPDAEPLLRRVLETGEPLLGIEIRGRTAASPDLQRHWISQYWPLKNGDGKVFGINVVVEEVTERKRLEESRRREYEFRTLAENSTDIIVRFDRTLRPVYANPAIETILGQPRDTVIGKTTRELGLPADVADMLDDRIRRAFAIGQECTMEFWLPTPKGKRYLQSHLIPELNVHGELETLLSITRDLTNNKQIEEALRESETRFRDVVDLVPDILYRADLPGYRASFISPAIERMMGFTAAEWQADPRAWLRQLHEDDRERVLSESRAALGHADLFTTVYRLWHKDRQSYRWFEDRARIARDSQGRAMAVLGVMTDVTDRIRAEEANRRREQEFRALAERSLDIVARIDSDFRVRYVNPAIETATGQSSSFFLNKTIRELGLSAELEPVWIQHVKTVLTTGKDCRFSFSDKGAGGKQRVFDTRVVPEFGVEGRVESVIAVTREITRLHETEERLRQTVEQLETLNERLEAQSRSDSLTGLANRRYLFTYMDTEWRRETRHGQSISLIIADIDFFKAYNDRHGHLAGDNCLQCVAEALRGQIHRPGDLLARYGGEEFVVVLPETSLINASDLAEAMRRAVMNLRMEHGRSVIAPYVTISLGVAELSPKEHKTDDLFMLADAALYRAKEKGRNRVECAP